jgi:hypothetical protein
LIPAAWKEEVTKYREGVRFSRRNLNSVHGRHSLVKALVPSVKRVETARIEVTNYYKIFCILSKYKRNTVETQRHARNLKDRKVWHLKTDG